MGMGGGKKASSSDSFRLGILLAQMYADKHTKSLPASVINILSRNRQVRHNIIICSFLLYLFHFMPLDFSAYA
jgi:hypothetical protein